MLLLSVDSLGSPIMVRFSGAVSLIMWYACTGAIPVTEGHFNSLTLPLLPGNTQFVCDGSESTLSECRNTSQAASDNECIRDDAGVVCQCQSKFIQYASYT